MIELRWLVARAICFVFGHRYQVVQEFSYYARRVVCSDCRGDWGMNDDVRAFIEWDNELTDLYRSQGHIVHNPWRDVPTVKEG